MSLHSLFKELPQFDIRPNENTHTPSIEGWRACACGCAYGCGCACAVLPGIGGEGVGAGPIVEQPSPNSITNDPNPVIITPLSSPIEEQEPEEEELEEKDEESEADMYWRTHPDRVKLNNNDNNKVKFVIE